MPFTKRTKKSCQLRDKYKNQSPRSRERRLKDMRERMSEHYSQLSVEEKQTLSKQSALNKSSQKKRQTKKERETTLAKHCSYTSQKRLEDADDAWARVSHCSWDNIDANAWALSICTWMWDAFFIRKKTLKLATQKGVYENERWLRNTNCANTRPHMLLLWKNTIGVFIILNMNVGCSSFVTEKYLWNKIIIKKI